MSATTDSEEAIRYDWEKQPGITNLLQILALLSGHDLQDVTKQWEGQESYGDFKKHVAQVVSDFLRDFQDRLESVDEQMILQKLETSEATMSEVAGKTLLRTQQAVGLRP